MLTSAEREREMDEAIAALDIASRKLSEWSLGDILVLDLDENEPGYILVGCPLDEEREYDRVHWSEMHRELAGLAADSFDRLKEGLAKGKKRKAG